jgi:hypothetical protein
LFDQQHRHATMAQFAQKLTHQSDDFRGQSLCGFIDDDEIPPPDWMRSIVGALDASGKL